TTSTLSCTASSANAAGAPNRVNPSAAEFNSVYREKAPGRKPCFDFPVFLSFIIIFPLTWQRVPSDRGVIKQLKLVFKKTALISLANKPQQCEVPIANQSRYHQMLKARLFVVISSNLKNAKAGYHRIRQGFVNIC
ncbi:MAG: hypothetical protein GY941_19425, partial [Planctomycetes bacterium]|nr:hypothetical protein [Planctomycetota bacterium]